jgi:hypothetical protein
VERWDFLHTLTWIGFLKEMHRKRVKTYTCFPTTAGHEIIKKNLEKEGDFSVSSNEFMVKNKTIFFWVNAPKKFGGKLCELSINSGY